MEESISPDLEKLLQDLRPENQHSVKLAAVQQFGEAATSDINIVKALITVKQSDPSYQVRKAAAEALAAAVHQDVLQQYPELAAVAAEEVRIILSQAASKRAPETARQLPPRDDAPAVQRTVSCPVVGLSKAPV